LLQIQYGIGVVEREKGGDRETGKAGERGVTRLR
jgi:hypothetical protein